MGVDPKSTYLYLLKVAKDRKAETWRAAFDEGKSPLDLLTRKDNPNLLKLLGY